MLSIQSMCEIRFVYTFSLPFWIFNNILFIMMLYAKNKLFNWTINYTQSFELSKNIKKHFVLSMSCRIEFQNDNNLLLLFVMLVFIEFQYFCWIGKYAINIYLLLYINCVFWFEKSLIHDFKVSAYQFSDALN